MLRQMRTPGRPPLWLIGLILFVVLWLAVRIVGNVTEALTGMVEGGDATHDAASATAIK